MSYCYLPNLSPHSGNILFVPNVFKHRVSVLYTLEKAYSETILIALIISQYEKYVVSYSPNTDIRNSTIYIPTTRGPHDTHSTNAETFQHTRVELKREIPPTYQTHSSLKAFLKAFLQPSLALRARRESNNGNHSRNYRSTNTIHFSPRTKITEK